MRSSLFVIVPGIKKAPLLSGAFAITLQFLVKTGLHALNVLAQTAFVTGGLIAVDQAFAGHAVDDRNGVLEGGFRGGFVACGYSVIHFLDTGAQHRTHGDITGAAGNGLLRAFSCLW